MSLQPSILSAADQLQGLDDELDLADATRPKLDVTDEIATCHLLFDELLHLAQTLEDAKIEVAAVDEGAYSLGIEVGIGFWRRKRAGLDPGVTLPIAAML